MVCPICLQLGLAAANYELNPLIKHIARRHPIEGILVGIVGAALITWGGPRVWRILTT